MTPEKLRVARDIAHLLARMEAMGAADMGELSHNEAASFHATTGRLRRLVDRLMAQADSEERTMIGPTAMTPRDWILAAIENDPPALEEGIRFLFNCREVEVSADDGGIWIADPQRGHWLGADDLTVVGEALKAGMI